MVRPHERGPRNSRCPGGQAEPDRHGLRCASRDFCAIADRMVDGTRSRSPNGHLRKCRSRTVRGDGGTRIFIEDRATCRPLRMESPARLPQLDRGARVIQWAIGYRGRVPSARLRLPSAALITRRGMRIAHRPGNAAACRSPAAKTTGSLRVSHERRDVRPFDVPADPRRFVASRHISGAESPVEIRQTCRPQQLRLHPVVGREAPGRDGAPASCTRLRASLCAPSWHAPA